MVVAVFGLAKSIAFFWKLVRMVIRIGAFLRVDVCHLLDTWFTDELGI